MESDDEDEEGAELEVPDEIHTVCHLCGGAGMIADPKLAVIGGVPRAMDNGRPCPACATVGHFAGILPPV